MSKIKHCQKCGHPSKFHHGDGPCRYHECKCVKNLSKATCMPWGIGKPTWRSMSVDLRLAAIHRQFASIVTEEYLQNVLKLTKRKQLRTMEGVLSNHLGRYKDAPSTQRIRIVQGGLFNPR